MPPNHPPPAAATSTDEERTRRVHATVTRLRAGPYAEARDLVEGMYAVADRSMAVFEQVGEIHAAASRAESAADRAADEARSIREELRAIRRGAELPPLAPMRPRAPSFSDADITANGGLRLDQDQFLKLQDRIASMQHAAELAEAEKKGAEKALVDAKKKAEETEAARERTQRRLAFYLAVATAAAGAVGWVTSHFLHL